MSFDVHLMMLPDEARAILGTRSLQIKAECAEQLEVLLCARQCNTDDEPSVLCRLTVWSSACNSKRLHVARTTCSICMHNCNCVVAVQMFAPG